METVYRLVITGIVIQWKSYVVAHGQLLDTVISIEMVQTSLTLLLYGGGVYHPPTKKWQLLLKIVILKSPNFVTFPIYL